MRIVLIGRGKMGTLIRETAAAAGDEIEAAFGRDDLDQLGRLGKAADVVMDFSRPAALPEIAAYVRRTGTPLLSGTTGYTEAEFQAIVQGAQKVPVFQSYNMSIGVALLVRLVGQAAAIFGGCDVEIVEAHHNRKADAPSGTALLLADAVKAQRPDAEYVFGRHGQHKRQPNEIGIHSLRMGNVVGEHEVIFSTDSQTITLKHQAHDRALFAEGALTAAAFLVGKPAGLYHMDDLLG